MAIWLAIKKIIDIVGSLGGTYLERKMVESKGKVTVAVAKAEAEATIQVALATSNIEWEKTMAEGSKGSWKDEYWTIILSIPFVAVFIPPLVPYLERGFNVLAEVPEWYAISVGLAISAAFGKNVVQHFVNMKKKI